MRFTLPKRLKAGDKVAIVSPSTGLSTIFPWVYQRGLQRLRDVFHLEPVEFPTALKNPEYLENNPQARADDINAAFQDESISAIIATIGGNDQIRILPYLDPKIITANPKPFLGYSDNTNLHLFLWNLGLISYYGGHIMGQFSMQGQMDDFTVNYLKSALFESSIGQIEDSIEWTDFDYEWADPKNLNMRRPQYKGIGWEWYNNKNSVIQGRLWGGCLETLALHFSVKKYLPSLEELSGAVLYLETSEEMPSMGFVYRFIASLGELGLLNKLKALLIAYPKGQFCGTYPPEGRESFIENQKVAIKKALKDYNSDLLTIFNLNFGHTDPQIIIPNGAMATIDCVQKTVFFD